MTRPHHPPTPPTPRTPRTPRTRRRCLVATTLALATLLPLGACSSSRNSGKGGDAYAMNVDPDRPTKPEYKIGYMLQWQGFPRITSRKGVQFFDVLGDTLVVQDFNQNVTVIETDTGRNRWAVLAGDRLKNFIGNVRADDHLLISDDTQVQIYDIKTGQITARQHLSVLSNTRPIVVDALAIYGGTTGEVLAHNLAIGFKAWGYQLAGSIRATPVLLAGKDVGVVSQGGDVIILDAERGASRGRRGKIFGGLANNPVGDDRAMYVASLDQSVYAFSRSDGQRLWRYRTESPITAQPTIHDGVLYVFVEREGLLAIDARTGSLRWANPDLKGTVMAMRKGNLLLWDGAVFTSVDPERGEPLDTIPFPDVKMLTFDTFVDGNLYTISRKGVVQKFAPSF